MDSPLKLNTYFFPHVQVSADPQYVRSKKDKEPDYDIKVGVEHDEENHYQVAVEIILHPEDEKNRYPYSVHLVGIGLFSVDPEWPEPEKLLRINAASIIYSAAREFLITITSRGPWGKIVLPTVSFLKYYKDQDRDANNHQPAEIKKKSTKKSIQKTKTESKQQKHN